MVAGIVEQVVDQPVAVGVVDRAVGEHEALEASQDRLADGPSMITLLPSWLTVASTRRKPNVMVSMPSPPSNPSSPGVPGSLGGASDTGLMNSFALVATGVAPSVTE